MMIVISIECFLCIYQLSQGTEFMTRISGNYASLFRKFKEFAGWKFRPWGTSHNPGGMSQYIYLTIPLVLLVDKESFKYLKGTEIDFTKEGLNEGFRFNNPNVSATCGCGESFSI